MGKIRALEKGAPTFTRNHRELFVKSGGVSFHNRDEIASDCRKVGAEELKKKETPDTLAREHSVGSDLYKGKEETGLDRDPGRRA